MMKNIKIKIEKLKYFFPIICKMVKFRIKVWWYKKYGNKR
ncbi:MAG: hypothetical protein UR22_C0002G0064 [Parcubacteria group bacterium GW2011_GWC2_32_10]|nr:MAG: hypothetical protein UR22_C0002G0064 [Parcubacteria group bacterium GW2011_GWC2_32_10]